MKYASEYTSFELMATTVARQIKNGDVAFIGIGVPMIAGLVASNTHAPETTLIFEAGGIGARSRRIAWSISDSPTVDNAIAASSMWRVLSDIQRGFISLGIIGGAQIDRFGNLNSTLITGEDGTFDRPRLKLPGSGGANDVGSSAQRTVIMMRLEKGKFVEKIDYLTTPGYLDGFGARERAGLAGGGPEVVITDHCTFRFDEATKEMYLDALFPGVTVDYVKKMVGWDLKVAESVTEVEPPTVEQIEIMRKFDPDAIILSKKSAIPKMDFPTYYQKMKAIYQN